MQEYRMDETIDSFPLDSFPIAMAYVPMQRFKGICDDLEAAYQSGTIFPELDLPFTGRRCVS